MPLNNTLMLEHLRKSYGTRLVVEDINMVIKSGEIVGFLGPNGAGKTTIFCIIAGLIAGDAGNIKLNNQDISSLSLSEKAKLGIGYLPQGTSIFRYMTAQDNIYAALETVEHSRQKRQERLEQLLKEFSLENIRRRKALLLSGGECRKVEIARALALNPSFLLLDEPFAGIDPLAVQDLQKIILRLKSIQVGILITDHNIRETLNIVDRAYIIYDGKILSEGTQRQILTNKNVKKFYLGDNF